MGDSDEHLLTAAKLREQIEGELEGHADHHDHTGIVDDPDHRANLSFLEAATDGSLYDSQVGEQILAKFRADRATKALSESNSTVLSHLVGVTEQDLDGSALRLPLRLVDELENNEAPAFPVVAGNPNTGKTNSMLLLGELRKATVDDLVVVANFDSSITDRRVTSAHDLAVTLLELRDRPKFVIIDEGSTHFDARTNRREVATQWTPLAKRFAKIGVDSCGIVVHTGKDLHPEAKRMATLPFYKTEKKIAEFYERWPADSDMPTDRLFGGSIEEIEEAGADYSPDDAAPWAWDLEPELFAKDLDWSELLAELEKRGPEV